MRKRILMAMALALALTSWPQTGALAQSGQLYFQARAFGVHAFTGKGVSITAQIGGVSLGGACFSEVGAHAERSVVSVTQPPLVTTGGIHTTADTAADQATASAETLNVNLLGGLITGQEVRAVSTTTRDAGGLHVSGAGSVLVNTVIAGNPVVANPSPNTTVNLPGLGHVVLNEQIVTTSPGRASLTVNMIHVYVTVVNSLGIRVGTQIIVSQAHSGLTQSLGPAVLDGSAYGASVDVLHNRVFTLKPIPLVLMPCLGTKGALIERSLLSIDFPPAVVTGTARVTARGTVTPTGATGETTSTVETLNLLNGLVTADVVRAEAHASGNGTTNTFSDAGSLFLNLSVSGHPEIDDNVAPNTQVNIAGLGTLYLHRVIESENSIIVRMIELHVLEQNSFGLPVGAKIRVAVASAGVH